MFDVEDDVRLLMDPELPNDPGGGTQFSLRDKDTSFAGAADEEFHAKPSMTV